MNVLTVPRTRRVSVVVMVVLALAASWLLVGAPRAHATNGKVLIIDTTLDTSHSFNEVDAAASLGLGADVVTEGQWATMTTAEFADYNAIVFGDPYCSNDDAVRLAEPLDNLSTWTPAVTGNVIVHTFDSIRHANGGSNNAGAMALTKRGIAFAAAQSGKTGMYLSSSCYNDDAWLTLLDGISSGWSTLDQSANAIHITGSTPTLIGLTDATLSDFHSSVHNLVDAWPSDFTVFAIATGGSADSLGAQGDVNAAATVPDVYTAPDGTSGTPVLLIRGEAVSASNIVLDPSSQSWAVNGSGTLNAHVTHDGMPISADTKVTFTALSGPNAGKTIIGQTGDDGLAIVFYSSALPGTDTWEASFVDASSKTQTSNEVTVEWTGTSPPLPPPPPAPAPVVSPARFTG